MKASITPLIAVLALASSNLLSAELLVPKDHPKIQAAIDASQSGDTILVAPGRYHERIRLKPGITVRSQGSDKKGNKAGKQKDRINHTSTLVVLASLASL